MQQPEVWMRGPVDGIPALLQPVAHTLLQAKEELNAAMKDFPETLLWERPMGLASAGFHLQHIPGVLDRLFTYAAGQSLSAMQMEYLTGEGKQMEGLTVNSLLTALDTQVEAAIARLKITEESSLTDFRGVGRKQLPSTVMGLLFHSAEHTMRHTGQLLVTVKVLKGNN